MKYVVPAFRHLSKYVLIVLLSCAAASSQVPAQPQAATPPTPQFDNRIFAEFDKLIHVKRAKTGDAVTAHLTAPAKLRDGTELPKGSKLVGSITDLKVKADKDGPSKLGLLFTSAVVKNGKETPVRMALVTVAPHLRQGEADLLSAGNPFSGGNRMQAGSGANTLNTTTNEGEALSRGLGARAPASKTSVGENQMLPGKSYLPDVVMVSYSPSSPGTILESKTGSVYVDSGSRLLLLVQ
jgi:hypothetical protein